MKEIKLSKGQSAFVDDEDYDELNKFKWFAIEGKHTFYAVRSDYETGKNKRVWMHREIFGPLEKNKFIDHRDQNGLNNQRSNLRQASRAQNKANAKGHKNSFSVYKGVEWRRSRNKWMARICQDGNKKCLGHFTDEKLAAIAYNNAAKKLFGEFASLNIV